MDDHCEKKKFGYARVSSRDQNLARQLEALSEAGIESKMIFTDMQSGKDFARPNYQRMVGLLQEGDELYIKSIDRLGRNYDEILEQWRSLTKTRKINIVVLDFPLLDTRNPIDGLTGEFIADLTLQILSYVAQMERESIHQRQLEGIREAKKRGVCFGRPRIPVPQQFEDIRRAVEEGRMSLRAGAACLGVSYTTLRNWIKQKDDSYAQNRKAAYRSEGAEARKNQENGMKK